MNIDEHRYFVETDYNLSLQCRINFITNGKLLYPLSADGEGQGVR